MTKDTMTQAEIAATLIEFRDVVGMLASLVVKPAGCEQVAAVQAKKVLPILKALRNGWGSEDPKASACWFSRSQSLGNRFAPGFVSDPAPVEYQPGLKVGAPHPRDPSFFVGAIAFDTRKGEGTVHFMQRADASAKPAEKVDRLGGVTVPTSTPEQTISKATTNTPTPIVYEDEAQRPTLPGEIHGGAAKAEFAARMPPGFNAARRP